MTVEPLTIIKEGFVGIDPSGQLIATGWSISGGNSGDFHRYLLSKFTPSMCGLIRTWPQSRE